MSDVIKALRAARDCQEDGTCLLHEYGNKDHWVDHRQAYDAALDALVRPCPRPIRDGLGQPLVHTRQCICHGTGEVTIFDRLEADVSSMIELRSDSAVLFRWLSYVDEWYRCMREIRKQRVVKGSKGQPRVNPLFEIVFKLEQRISQVEQKFGWTPLDRMRLGIDFAEASRTLEALNRGLNENDDEDEYDDLPAEYEVKS